MKKRLKYEARSRLMHLGEQRARHVFLWKPRFLPLYGTTKYELRWLEFAIIIEERSYRTWSDDGKKRWMARAFG